LKTSHLQVRRILELESPLSQKSAVTSRCKEAKRLNSNGSNGAEMISNYVFPVTNPGKTLRRISFPRFGLLNPASTRRQAECINSFPGFF
jgi:hypothetical protein